MTGNLSFGDNNKAIFGADDDLQVNHSGSTGLIANYTGSLFITNSSDDYDVVIQSDNGSGSLTDYFRADGSAGAAILYNYGSSKLATTATGIDVTGTVVADGLTVAGNNNGGTPSTAAVNKITLKDTDVSTGTQRLGQIDWHTSDTDNAGVSASIYGYSNNTSAITSLRFATGTASSLLDRVDVGYNGDISFYEDTGTTAKFKWSASNETIAIGTGASSTATISAYSRTVSAGLPSALRIIENTGASAYWDIGSDGGASPNLKFYVNANTTPKLTLTSGGNVGIGTSSPLSQLNLHQTGGAELRLTSPDAITYGELIFSSNNANYSGYGASISGVGSGGVNTGNLVFSTGQGAVRTERVRITGAGDLLVGKTATGINVEGFEATSAGYIAAVRDGGIAAYFQRKTSDGAIIDFRKDNTTVGSIGTATSDTYPYFASSTFGFRLRNSTSTITPSTSSGANNDAAVDLGYSGARFKDLYLSGGVYLGGTVAANYLDDYEEGTWDITITDLTNNATLNASYDTGVYTKVGRLVTLTGRFIMTSKGSLSGRIYISGIPFNGIGGNSYSSGGFTAGKADGLAITAGTSIGGEITSNSDRISLVLWDSADGSSYMDTTNLDATADMSFSITYMTAA